MKISILIIFVAICFMKGKQVLINSQIYLIKFPQQVQHLNFNSPVLVKGATSVKLINPALTRPPNLQCSGDKELQSKSIKERPRTTSSLFLVVTLNRKTRKAVKVTPSTIFAIASQVKVASTLTEPTQNMSHVTMTLNV